MSLSAIQSKRDKIDLLYSSPLSAISDCLRGFIVSPPGYDLIAADFANIEGRVLAWLSGEDWKLKAFQDFDKGHGPDIYKLSAQRIFNCALAEINYDKRQIGKVAELALGYQGGKVAFQKMAKNYGVKIADEKANDIKTAWREAHPKIVKYWWEIEKIAIMAANKPGEVFFTGPKDLQIKFRKVGSFLFCRLPSGRAISYPYPTLKQKTTPWGDQRDALHYMGITNNQWCEQSAYGGLLTENITQAVARDILAESLKRCEKNGYPVVMHVHDCVVSEIPESKGSLTEFKKIICELPTWAKGLPIVAEGYRGKRFQK
jgi:DNA polymerase